MSGGATHQHPMLTDDFPVIYFTSPFTWEIPNSPFFLRYPMSFSFSGSDGKLQQLQSLFYMLPYLCMIKSRFLNMEILVLLDSTSCLGCYSSKTPHLDLYLGFTNLTSLRPLWLFHPNNVPSWPLVPSNTYLTLAMSNITISLKDAPNPANHPTCPHSDVSDAYLVCCLAKALLFVFTCMHPSWGSCDPGLQ